MYAWVNAKKNSGIYRSDDAGESWQQVNGEERIYGRGDDFGCVQVDPRNKDTIYVANTSTYRSTDGARLSPPSKALPEATTTTPSGSIPTIPTSSPSPSIKAQPSASTAAKPGAPGTTSPRAVLSRHHRQPVSLLGLRRPAGKRLRRTASRSDFGEITFRDWTTVGVEEYGYVAPDPLHPI